MLTSNKQVPFLGDEVMAAALLDRLLHHCHIVNIRGNLPAAEAGGPAPAWPGSHGEEAAPMFAAELRSLWSLRSRRSLVNPSLRTPRKDVVRPEKRIVSL